MKTVVVTRHPSLVDFLTEIGLISEGVEVLTHVDDEDQIAGKHVIGVLPNYLSCKALSLTEVPLNIPKELRGQELSLDQIREFAGKPQVYVVRTAQDFNNSIRCAEDGNYNVFAIRDKNGKMM